MQHSRDRHAGARRVRSQIVAARPSCAHRRNRTRQPEKRDRRAAPPRRASTPFAAPSAPRPFARFPRELRDQRKGRHRVHRGQDCRGTRRSALPAGASVRQRFGGAQRATSARSMRRARRPSRSWSASCGRGGNRPVAATAIAGSSATPRSGQPRPRRCRAQQERERDGRGHPGEDRRAASSARGSCRTSSVPPAASHQRTPQPNTSGTKLRSPADNAVTGAIGEARRHEPRQRDQQRPDEDRRWRTARSSASADAGGDEQRPRQPISTISANAAGERGRSAGPRSSRRRPPRPPTAPRSRDCRARTEPRSSRRSRRAPGTRAASSGNPGSRAPAQARERAARRRPPAQARSTRRRIGSRTSAACSAKPTSGTPKTSSPSTGSCAASGPRRAYRIAIVT